MGGLVGYVVGLTWLYGIAQTGKMHHMGWVGGVCGWTLIVMPANMPMAWRGTCGRGRV